jgi:DNA-binding transcriptional LysR family regulator
MAEIELRPSQLVHLLQEYEMEGANVYAVLPAGPRPSTKVLRALVEFLADELPRRRSRQPITSVELSHQQRCISIK